VAAFAKRTASEGSAGSAPGAGTRGHVGRTRGGLGGQLLLLPRGRRNTVRRGGPMKTEMARLSAKPAAKGPAFRRKFIGRMD